MIADAPFARRRNKNFTVRMLLPANVLCTGYDDHDAAVAVESQDTPAIPLSNQ